MLSRLLKPPSKESKRKGGKDDLKDALHEHLTRLRHEDISSLHTPGTPRLERARNLRWHLIELDNFEDVPRRSVSSYSVASDNSRHDPLSPTLSEPILLNDVENKRLQHPLAPLESSPENASNCPFSHSHGSSQFPQLQTCDERNDGYGTSSEYSAGSSNGSPPKVTEDVRAGLGRNAVSSVMPRTRKKLSTQRRLRANAPEKLMTVSSQPPYQERIEGLRFGSPLPSSSTKVPFKTNTQDLMSPLGSPRISESGRPIPQRSKGIDNNISGPIWVQEHVDLSSYQRPLKSPLQCPLQSPRRSPLSSPKMQSQALLPQQAPKTQSQTLLPQQDHPKANISAPIWVQEGVNQSPYQSPVKSPLQSPRRSPLSSPKTPSRALSPQRDHHTTRHDDSQNAHPLPLPVSPSSGASSADRSEDSGRVDSPLVSTRWSRCPGRADVIPPGGKWIKGTLLGSGSFGKVYRGHHSETGDMCAIKEVEIVPDDPRSKECAMQLYQEITFLCMLRHPNILHYKGSEMVGESLYIYLELVSGGSIYRLLQEFNNFREPVIRRYTHQILLGLQYLHGKNTVHRDIKCANVLVDQDGRVKLADFGTAKLIGKQTSPLSFKGSPYWMAPEVILQNNSGFECAVDIWSLGCTVIEMATGKPPWFQYPGYAAMFKVMNCHDVPIPTSLSAIGQDFVSLCLQRDPSKRPSALALLEHPFVQVDKNQNTFRQPVQSMPERSTRKELDGLAGLSPFLASRDPVQSTLNFLHLSNSAASPRPSDESHMPTSRSALKLSGYSRSGPIKGVRRFGPLTDTEDYTSRYEELQMNKGSMLPRIARQYHTPRDNAP